MKKLLSVIVLAGSALAAFGQGTVSFNNGGLVFSDTNVDRLVYLDRVGGTKLTGTNYAAQLWYQPATGGDMVPVANSNAFKLFRPGTTLSPGTWNTAPGGATVTFPDVAISGMTHLQVRVWDVSRFATWQLAMQGNGLHGESVVFDYTVPQPGSLPALYALEGLRAFNLVPEPSILALGALAVGAFFLRRRKQS
jgi:hypothetical protein